MVGERVLFVWWHLQKISPSFGSEYGGTWRKAWVYIAARLNSVNVSSSLELPRVLSLDQASSNFDSSPIFLTLQLRDQFSKWSIFTTTRYTKQQATITLIGPTITVARRTPAMPMEIQFNNSTGVSLSSSSSDSNLNNSNSNPEPVPSWWESISKARSRIQALSSILSSSTFSSISSRADSDRPARSLLESHEAYLALSSSLSSPISGSGDDHLCQWLYETFQSSDTDLHLIVLSFVPLLSGLYLSRIISPLPENSNPSLAGFEAVLLAIYTSETKSRAGKPCLVTLPDLSQPSLYDSPKNNFRTITPGTSVQPSSSVRVLCPPLEPQVAVKSTKRAFIVSIALDCYYKQISQMPRWSKLDLCRFSVAWAGQNCSCRSEFDVIGDGNGITVRNVCEIRDFGEDSEINEVVEEMQTLGFGEDGLEIGGARIPLPWELFQPVLRILGHCLLAPLNPQDVKDAASFTARCLYARASHELVPQAILATRSLIQLDKRARLTAKTAAEANAGSSANTPSKARKPEVLLASK